MKKKDLPKTEQELTNDFNNTELGKKYLKPVKICTIILIIALIPYIYTILDQAFKISKLDDDLVELIDGLFNIILIISVLFDARYYGALAQYKEDRK